MERTTEQHRAAVEAWRATAPKDDQEILGTTQIRPKKTRHRDLAELPSLLEFYRRPDGVAEGGPAEPAAPVKSNWRLIPANDNVLPDDGSGVERAVEYIPSVEKITTSVNGLEFFYRQEPMKIQDEFTTTWNFEPREVHAIPVGGDVEYGFHVDDNGKRHKTITRIGGLRFSDGTQTEAGFRLEMNQVVPARIPMPVGAMLGTREKSTRDKGSTQDPVELACTLDFFAGRNDPPGLFQGQFAHRTKKKEKAKRSGPKTKAEARQWLEDAAASTPIMPKVTKCPDGFPASPKNLAHLFPGLVKVATGDSGSQAWEGIASEFEERNEWYTVLQEMKDEHVEMLTKATRAKSLQELGEIRGYMGKYAIEAGRKLLVAANDNFLLAKKIATEAKST